MRRVVVTEHLTFDGVMQAPGSPEEDTRGGFRHGGWAMPNNDEVMARVLGAGMAQGGPLLFGRRTYEGFYGYWPHQTDNPFTEVLNNIQKYVTTTTTGVVIATYQPTNAPVAQPGGPADATAAETRPA